MNPHLVLSAVRERIRARSKANRSFSHLPVIFVPAEPTTSALPKNEKAKVRRFYALSEVGRDARLKQNSSPTTTVARAVETSAVGEQANFCR